MSTLLLVDDDEMLARAFAFKLRSSISTLTVITASTCDEALRAANRYKPGVLVADYWLPDGDGLSLQKQISKKLKNIQTIMISAYWDEFGRREAETENTLRVLDKPFEVDELIAAVKEALMIEGALGSPEQESPQETPGAFDGEEPGSTPVVNGAGSTSDLPLFDGEMANGDVLNGLKNVMIVDPSSLNAGMCNMVFAPYPKCSLVLAKNGAQALGKVKGCRMFDLIITECNLPDMDGMQLLEELRRLRYDHIPMIVVTNIKEPRNIILAMEAGAAGYLIKPWRSSNFRKLLTTVVTEQNAMSRRSLAMRQKRTSISVASFDGCYEYTQR